MRVLVEVVILAAKDGALSTLLHPGKAGWHLPGTPLRDDESLEDAARRVVAAQAGLKGVFLEQLYTFGRRGQPITVAYYALVAAERLGDAGVELIVPWEGETGGPVELEGRQRLVADHSEILGMAVKRLRGKLDYTPIGFQLLGDRFTLLELQRVHETVLGRPLNKDSFRRRMLASTQLEATGEMEQDVDHRPAELYRFARRSAI